MSKRTELAKETFSEGFNCAQTVFTAFSEDYGIPVELANKLAGALGGGACAGELCGAVSGALLVIGLKYGQTKPNDADAKKLCIEKATEFEELFKGKFGSIVCRDILNFDPSTKEGKAYMQKNPNCKDICTKAKLDAIELLESLGY